MSRKVKVVFLIVLVSILGYRMYELISDRNSYLGTIHKDSDVVIRIGLYDIKKTILWDAIGSPSYYYKQLTKEKKKKEDGKTEKDESSVFYTTPSNLFVYCLKNNPYQWFTVIHITNKELFKSFLNKKVLSEKVEIQHTKTYDYADVGHGFFVAWNNSKAVFTLLIKEKKKEALELSLLSMFETENFIQQSDHLLIKRIKKQKGHIAFVSDAIEMNINVKDQLLELEGQRTNQESSSYEQIQHQSSSFYLSSNLATVNIDNLTSTLGDRLNISNIDTLMSYLKGQFVFEIDGVTAQQDTVITYEYDDNFEMVAQKTIQKKNVPSMSLTLTTQNGFLNYLKQINWVDNTNTFTKFPLYKTKVSQREECFFLTTNNSLSDSSTIERSNKLLDFYINFSKLNHDLKIPHTEHYFSLLNCLQIQVSPSYIQGSLVGTNEDINILSQIYFEIQKPTLTIDK